jgi:two-component system, NarL family, nitrate/nitrite response regulator NarL
MRVLIVNGNRMFADAIRSVLEGRGVEVVGIAESAPAAIETAIRTRPDVVVIDVGIRDGGGLRAGEGIIRADLGAKVIALASLDEVDIARQALALGFQGCLTKEVGTHEFADAVRAVGDGEMVWPSQLARRPSKRWPGDGQAQVLVGQLTPREREVLRLIAAAAGNEEIGRRLAISVNTVRSHIQSIFTKLQVHSRLEAVAFAARNGLLSAPVANPYPLLPDGMPLAAGERGGGPLPA